MKPIEKINALRRMVAVIATLALATGCSSTNRQGYNYYSGGNTPVVVSPAPPPAPETPPTGLAGSQFQNNPANKAAGAAPPISGQSTGAGTGGPVTITQLNQLTANPDATALAGEPVNLQGEGVQQVVGDHVLVVGPDDGSPVIYVISAQPVVSLAPGDAVNMKGTVRAVPKNLSNLGLDQTSSQALQGQVIYVEAAEITPANQ